MSALLSQLLWSAVPSQLTHALIPKLTAALPNVFPPGDRSSRAYRTNYRIVYTLLVAGYLLWQLASSAGASADDWYSLLGVRRTADDATIKRSFRSLCVAYYGSKGAYSKQIAEISPRPEHRPRIHIHSHPERLRNAVRSHQALCI